jgi:hypothetical protein
MKQGQDEYFAVVGEGAALLMNLGEQSPGFFDDLNRLREILAMLGYSSANGPIKFSLADKAGSLAALSEYVNNGIKLLPDELAAFELLTMYDLTVLAGGNYSKVAEELSEHGYTLKSGAGENATKLAAFETLSARGVKHGILQSDLNAMLDAADAHLAKKPEDNPEFVAAKDEYARITKERTETFQAMSALIKQLRDDGQDVLDLIDQRQAAMIRTGDEQTAAYERYNELHQAYNRDRVDGHKAIFEANGNAIIAKLAEASPVTQEQADAWAAEQVIDAGAKAKLKKLGYPLADVVRDMAEFYRLTGGKASAIRISVNGSKRANAVGITERLGEKVINLGARFNKVTLFHELGHFLEGDPIARGASNGFLLKRREGDGVHRLRDLTGNKGYDSREVAYKDHFMDAYVGKYYQDGVTEVFSMGAQYLSNPKDAAIFAAKDPEMFALITGYLSVPLTPAMHAKLNMHAGAVGEAMQKKQDEETLYQRAVAHFAGLAPLVRDDWFDKLDKTGQFYGDLDWFVFSRSKKKPVEYVGAVGEKYRVFAGMFRNPVTKRNSKGFIIADISSLSISEAITGDLETARALIGVTEHNGVRLSDSRYGYFLEGWASDRKKKLINLAGMENLQ